MSFKEYLKKVAPAVILVIIVLIIAEVFDVKPLSYWW